MKWNKERRFLLADQCCAFYCIMKSLSLEMRRADGVKVKKRAIVSPLKFSRSDFQHTLLQNPFNLKGGRKCFKKLGNTSQTHTRPHTRTRGWGDHLHTHKQHTSTNAISIILLWLFILFGFNFLQYLPSPQQPPLSPSLHHVYLLAFTLR